jgi:hypothetical protein
MNLPEDIPHLGDKCPYCIKGKLVKHRNAGKGQYKDYPSLLVCPLCWHKFDPDHDMAPVKTQKKVRLFRRKIT